MFDTSIVNVAEYFIYCFGTLNGILNFDHSLKQIEHSQNFQEIVGILYEIQLNEVADLGFGARILFRNDYYSNTYTYILELQSLNSCKFTIITEYPSELIFEDGGYKIRFTTNEIIDSVKFKIIFT
jgi:hypothetical protein